MKNLRSHLLMKKKNCSSSIKSPNHIIFSQHKRLSPLPILFSLLQLYVRSIVILYTCAVFFLNYYFFYIVDSRSGGTFDMEAQRVLMTFYFP